MSDSFRQMTDQQLRAARHTNEVFLARLHDTDDPAEQRKVDLMREGIRKFFAAIFWPGIGLLAIGGLAWWIRDLTNRPSR